MLSFLVCKFNLLWATFVKNAAAPAIDCTYCQPGRPSNLSGETQMQPDVKTNEKTEPGRQPALPPVLRPAYTVLPKSSGVHRHESNKSSEIEQFGALRIR